MMVIYVQCKVLAEKREEFMEQALSQLNDASAPGCIRYSWMETLNERNTFTLYEEWSSLEAFNAYTSSERFKQMSGHMFPLMAEPPVSNYYTATAYTAPAPVAN
ncbi:MAG: antibiotic biosynthesis monooxygenase [Burkholderiales bacterium]|nr:antibiotic biosynthesis monooxygenase [Anaerolineae bacterium]